MESCKVVRPIRQTVATLNCLVLAAFSFSFATAQAQQSPKGAVAVDKQLGFEVASIKPSKADDQGHNWNGRGDPNAR